MLELKLDGSEPNISLKGKLEVNETEELTEDDPGEPQEGVELQDDPESRKESGKAKNAVAKMLDESEPASQKPSSGKLEKDDVEEDDPGERRE